MVPLSLSALPRPRRTKRPEVAMVCAFLLAACAVAAGVESADPAAQRSLVRFAFSKSLFNEVNENDARAAVKVYSEILADENGITTGGGTLVLEGTNTMAEALRLNQVDLLSVTAEEFFALEDSGLTGPLLLTSVKDSFTEEYVVLVREASKLRKLEDLQGRSVIVSSEIRGSLAHLWLEVLCREHGLGPVEQAFARVTRASKPTLVILPVFFGKADACITTRSSWTVMGELNPQVTKQLRFLAVSKPLVPAMTAFRRDFREDLRQRIIQSAETSYTKPSLQQLMGLFKTDSLVCQPLSVLESTRELLASHRRLCAPTNAVAARVSVPAEGGVP